MRCEWHYPERVQGCNRCDLVRAWVKQEMRDFQAYRSTLKPSYMDLEDDCTAAIFSAVGGDLSLAEEVSRSGVKRLQAVSDDYGHDSREMDEARDKVRRVHDVLAKVKRLRPEWK